VEEQLLLKIKKFSPKEFILLLVIIIYKILLKGTPGRVYDMMKR